MLLTAIIPKPDMLVRMDPVSVLILASDPLARAGLAQLLADEDNLFISGQLSADAALAEPPLPPADVVLWDLGWDPPDALPDVGDLGPPVLALVPSEEDVGAARRAGAQGILLRSAAASTVVAALCAVVEGLFVANMTLLESALPLPGSTLDPGLTFDDLTAREMDVLRLLAQGVTNRAIGQALHISEYTVKFHVNAIMGKLRAQSRTEAVVTATRAGLIAL